MSTHVFRAVRKAGRPSVSEPTEFEEQLLVDELERYRRAGNRRQWLVRSGRILVVVFLLALWEAGSGWFLDPFFVSSPSAVGRAVVRLFLAQGALVHIGFTLAETLIGYMIGAIAGLIGAILLILREEVYEILEPLILALYGIPRIALAPLVIMWLGIGILPKIVIAALMVFFVVLINTVAGFRNMDPWYVHVSRILGASRSQVFAKVIFPAAAPYLITSLRITIPMAMIGALVGEFISANRGVGFLINQATHGFDTALAFAGVFILLVVVVAMNSVISIVERRSLRWLSGRGQTGSGLGAG